MGQEKGRARVALPCGATEKMLMSFFVMDSKLNWCFIFILADFLIVVP
jgi:hypothetical protein